MSDITGKLISAIEVQKQQTIALCFYEVQKVEEILKNEKADPGKTEQIIRSVLLLQEKTEQLLREADNQKKEL